MLYKTTTFKTILTLLIITPVFGFSQYLIRLKIINPKDSIVYVKGTVFDEKNFIPKDTVKIAKGVRQSSYQKSIIGGVYYLEFPVLKQKIFFTLEKKDTLSFSFDGNDPLSTITCNKKSNQRFIDYQRLEKKLFFIDSIYNEEIRRGRKFNLTQKDAFFKDKRDSLHAFRKAALLQLKANDILSLHFKTLNTIDEYLPKRSETDAREAFINKFDLNEPKLLFTTNLQDILFEYLSAFPLAADSLNKGIDTIMSKIQCTNKAMPYMIDYFIKILKNRNVQKNTEGLNAMIEKYIIKGKCPFPNNAIKEEYMKLYEGNKKLNADSLSKNVILKDTLNNEQSLHEFAKGFDYTLIMFYAPTCEHCQVEVPQMDSTVSVLEKKYNISIGKYAICNESGIPESLWKKFIIENKLTYNYLHVQLLEESTVRSDYDAYSNPMSFLITRNGVMLARKISPLSLRNTINTLMTK
jgi:hypothetical protein